MAMKSLVGCVGHIVIGASIGLTLADHVGHIGTVEGPCMQPLLNPEENDKDSVLLNRWSVRNYQIQRGDIIILGYPLDPHTQIGKRVIALEGDTIRTLGYKEPYVTVPLGHCWVEGDNHGRSTDSNYFGPVSVSLVIAKVTHVLWPPRRWQKLSTAVPSDRAPLTEQDLLKLQEDIGTPKLSTYFERIYNFCKEGNY